ncbi:MAG TPA: helix-turn-helix domain-containing protein, partial [Gammaproteobacteria bacterium]|nr:helix-turn-helix domain-containing protein [Gammaproteobacteria bacterium]
VRVVCATHQNLKELIKTKNFREDLFYRISEITLNIPPLRERKTDPLLLARVFLRRFSTELNFGVKGFMPDAILAITQYPWPGNVRELEHKIKRAVIMSEAAYIKAEDLDLPFNPENSIPLSLKQIRENAEKEAVLKALQIENNNLSKAASRLGITRPTLYSIMERLNLPDKAQIE